MNKLAANVVGTLLTVLFCGAGLVLANVLPHHRESAGWHPFLLLAGLVILFPAHEGLHALGLLIFARISLRHIRFGMMWGALMPYCHCNVPIPAAAYRRMALLPLWVTGTTCVAALLVFPVDALGVLAGVAIAGCVGDVWVVAKLRIYADELLVQDSTNEVGCDILAPSPDTGGQSAARGDWMSCRRK